MANQTRRIDEIEASGKKVWPVDMQGRVIWHLDCLRAWMVIDLAEVVATSEEGLPIHVARNGYEHKRVVIREQD